MMSKRILILLLLACGCMTSRPQTNGLRASVEVNEHPRTDSWRVTIKYSRPADGLVFDVTREPFRAAAWHIVKPANARWIDIDHHDAISFAEPTDTVVLEFKSDLRPREKDYHVNVGFSDGSRLLYTGHLRSRPIFGIGTYDPRENVVHDWHFVTDTTRRIRLLDIAGTGLLRWPTPTAHWYGDTFVYFGPIRPMSTRNLQLIADPALPPWLVPRLLDIAPRLFDDFARQTGTTLEFQPLAFVSWSGGNSPGFSFAGSTLTGVMQIAIAGSGWLQRTPESDAMWLRNTGHEIFHLWGGQVLTPADDAEWLSEASAEYFALVGLRDANVISEAMLHKAVVEAANECIARIGDASILQSGEEKKFRNFYTCGLVTQFLADRAIAGSSSHRRSIGTLYETMFDDVRTRTRRYSTADFENALGRLSTDTEANREIAQLVEQGVAPAPDAFFEAALQRAGVEVSRVPLADATVNEATLVFARASQDPALPMFLRLESRQ